VLLKNSFKGQGYDHRKSDPLRVIEKDDLPSFVKWLNDQGVICSYEKAGFTLEGKFREAQYLEGKYVDVMIMSVLSSEWQTIKNKGL
jgi:hypothetical protein